MIHVDQMYRKAGAGNKHIRPRIRPLFCRAKSSDSQGHAQLLCSALDFSNDIRFSFLCPVLQLHEVLFIHHSSSTSLCIYLEERERERELKKYYFSEWLLVSCLSMALRAQG